MEQINISHIENLNNDYLRGIEFYKQELNILQKRLEEIAADNTGKEVAQQIEHFQNQFIIQQKNISDLRHAVKNYVTGLSNDAKDHGGHVDAIFITQGESLKERYEQLEQIMNSLRHEFNDYLSKWM